MAPQRCPYPNPQKLWICHLTCQRDSADVIKDPKMERLSWIIWEGPTSSLWGLYKWKREAGKSEEIDNEADVQVIWPQAKEWGQSLEAGKSKEWILP